MIKLDKENIEDILKLTPMQEGLLFHYLKDDKSSVYDSQVCLSVTGEIDINIFKKAWNFVVECNEVLRCVFQWEKVKNSLEIVLKRHSLEINFINCQKTNGEFDSQLLNKAKTNDKIKKFYLKKTPFRITFFKLAE